jgi:hypothetical protein
MAIKYLRHYENGTVERVDNKPSYGGVLVEKSAEELGDIFKQGKWNVPSNTPVGELTKETTLDFFGDGSCIATYNLNGDATDLSGNYNGTATNVTYVDGKFRQAGFFNGSSSINNPSIVWKGKTISMWFKANTINYGSSPSVNNNGSGTPLISTGNHHNIHFSSAGNTLSFCVLADTWYNIRSTTNNFSIGSWYNVVAIIDSNNIKIAINGNIESSTQFNGTMSPVTGVSIGANTNNANGAVPTYFNGSIDQVRIFDRALTESEVQELYYTYNQTWDSSEQFTYLSQDGKLLGVEVANGNVVDIHLDDNESSEVAPFISVPAISCDSIMVGGYSTNGLLGVGQTWQDVKSSRSSMVTYTNTSGKPIQVAITIGSGGNTTRSFYINGVAVAYAYGYDWADYSTMNFIIPNGATYKADGGYTISKWFELR